MDVGKFLQDYQGIVGAVVGFAAAQLFQLWRDHLTETRAIGREQRADRRAIRDAKLARMRTAFEPVLVVAGGLQTAAAQYLYSATGNPDADAQKILETSLGGVNEARAQLWLEEGVGDVSAELERAFRAFQTIQFDVGGKVAGRSSAISADEL